MSVNQLLTKPVVSAGVSAVALPLAMGGGQFSFRGSTYPVWMLGAALGGLTAFTSEAVHNYVLPHIPHGTQRLMQYESLVLSVGATGGSYILACKLLNGAVDFDDAKKLFMAGSLVEVASSYITTNLVGHGTI